MPPPPPPSGGPRRFVPVPGLLGPDDLPPDDAPASPALEPTGSERPAAGPSEPGRPTPGRPAPDESGPTAAGLHPPLAERSAPEASPPPAPAPVPSPAIAPPGTPSLLGGVGQTAAPPRPYAPPRPEPTPRPDPAEILEAARSASRHRGRQLLALVLRYGRAHLPAPAPRAIAPDDGPPRLAGRVGQVIPYLRVIPWVLTLGFGVSFFWDFPDAAVVLFGQVLALEGLLRVLSVSGLIGFLTNWLAITMLFQPRQKRAIIPQGLIPAQRERVIYRLSDAISRELINAEIIKAKIQESGVVGRYRDLGLGVVRGVVEDPGFRGDLKTLATDYAQEVLGSEAVRRQLAALAVQKVEEQAGQGVGGLALRLYRTFAEDDFQRRIDKALRELPQAVAPLLDRIDAALDAVPARIEARAPEIEEAATRAILSFVEGFDIRAMIMEKARGFDEAQLEGLLKSTSNEQLNYIKYLGAILGTLGGFVIWQPVGALAAFGATGLALWAADEALVRLRDAQRASSR